MIKYTFLIIYIITIIFGISNNKVSKKIWLLAFAFMTILFSYRNYLEGDTEVYHILYDTLKSTPPKNITINYGMNYAFIWLMWLFAHINISFEFFRIIIFTVSMFLMLNTVTKITEKISLFLCMYFLFPFGYDIDQIRQLLSLAIVIFAFRYIIFEEKHFIKYSVLVLLASLIHMSSIVFYIYLLIYIKKDKLYKYILIFGSIIYWINIIFHFNWIGYIYKIFRIDKLLSYTNEISQYRMGILLGLFEFLFFSFFIWQSYIFYKNEEKDVNYNIMRLSCLSGAFLPFIAFSLSFERIIRPMILLNYCVFCDGIFKKKQQFKPLLVVGIMVVIALRCSISMYYLTKIFDNCTF